MTLPTKHPFIKSVFQKEIATHLKVIHIKKTDIYDQAKDAEKPAIAALGIMRQKYSGNKWANQAADLHHALLSFSGGGVAASIGGICDRNLGFGVTAGIKGKFEDIGSETVNELSTFAHELGHNFGSVHSHNYNPVIDTCGLQNADGSYICPSNIQNKSATLMSYCHLW